MKKDYIFTLLTQAGVLLSFLLTYKLISIKFGDDIFDIFSFIKRFITFILAFLGLGLYTALIKYISIDKHQSNNLLKSSFLFSILLLIIVYIFILILNINNSPIIYRYGLNGNFLFPIFVMLVGMYLHNLIYAYYRGLMLFMYANTYETLSKALAPFISIILSKNLLDFFLIHGFYQIFLASLVYIKINKYSLLINFDIFVLNIKKLIFYGIRRIGADFGLNFLFILPVIMLHNDKLIGFVSFSLTLLNVTGYITSPLGNVLFPRLSHLFYNKNYILAKNLIVKVIIIVSIMSLIFQIFLYYFKYEILSFFIKEISLEKISIFDYMIFVILPYMIFIIGRNIIDAYYIKGVNSKNIIISIFIYLGSYYILQNFNVKLEVSIIAFVISLIYLGIVTLMKIFNFFKRIL